MTYIMTEAMFKSLSSGKESKENFLDYLTHYLGVRGKIKAIKVISTPHFRCLDEN
jgi:hypothetical protein